MKTIAKMVVSNIASSNTTLYQPNHRVSPVRFAVVVIGAEVSIVADFNERYQTMEVLREKIDEISQITEYAPLFPGTPPPTPPPELAILFQDGATSGATPW